MAQRIWVEAGKFSDVEVEVEPGLAMSIDFAQVKQLILDLNSLIEGHTPEDEPSIEGVEN